MLRKLLGKDPDSLSDAEEASISRLATTYSRLLMDGGRVNTKSEAGFNACAMFLDGLDAAARTMRLDPAARTYRVTFTINYRALFPDEARNYRVDVLEASVEQYAVIWVNGDKFEFSAEAMRRAEALQHAWTDLGMLLERWSQAIEQPRGTPRPGRSELRVALLALDGAWASFEHKYITELIEIEEKARRLIVQAIEHERCLQLMEAQHGKAEMQLAVQTPEYHEEQRRLVACIARLNSVANFRRKGRDDLAVDVLDDAISTLRRCDAEERGSTISAEALSAARILATDVIESFQAMRSYLREVERCLERVDPHLCNNVGLVARLVDWEESWEVGARYVQHAPLLNAVCDLVAEIRAAQRVAPALTAMCDDCDVELFLCLPRIIWLRFLAETLRHLDLLKSLLPHRFNNIDTRSVEINRPWSAELDDFIEKFRHAKQLLVGAQPAGAVGVPNAAAADLVAWEILVRRVVNGAGAESEDVFGRLAPSLRETAVAAVEDLMHDLERWSIELQRHCPEDWNQCVAILVQCLAGGQQKQRHSPFRV
eukprot:gnl/TRDRNA2_/TRDRNA2_87748_c0_seq1.p1 gnl/TRDRNA2_/TRDRNA2_87748_c0~~gnl/TRDRNA2_/TRDRNA2_87748_c0_seq1.p1  ORF type:complete len:574 (-),score=112.71 gnl/TRDRNA2_/TRDRNA2_87748_c0_seq1:113-1738(-)